MAPPSTVQAEVLMQAGNHSETTLAVKAAGQHRAVAFWHAWSALMIAPVLLVLLLTGAIYLFDRELDGVWYQQALQTTPNGQQLHSLRAQQLLLQQLYPAARPERVLLARQPQQAVRWQLATAEGPLLVYVDPYQLKINATQDPASAPLAIVRRLHGELLAGPAGGYLVEWMSCWTLLLLLTGGWLWWPRQWRLAGVFWPRRRADGRLHWRDWHAIPALLASGALAFLVLTGLPWSTFWGEQFASVSARLGPDYRWIAPSPNFHLPPAVASQAADPHAEHRRQAAVALTDGGEAWISRQLPQPQVVRPATDAADEAPDISVAERELSRLPLAEFGPGVRLIFPATADQAFKISYVPDQAQGQRTIFVDPHSGAVLEDIGWQRYSLAAKVIEWGVMVHLGRQYGLVNQLVNLLFCLVGLVAVLAGLRLWWQRRRHGRWLPALGRHDRLPPGLKLSLVLLVLCFPLLWASVLLYASWRGWQRRQLL